MPTLPGVANIIGALVTIAEAGNGRRHRLIDANARQTDVVRANVVVVRTGRVIRHRGIAQAFRIAVIFGAFVAIIVAGTTGNRDVSALPIQTNIVRARVFVIVAEIGVWIGIMGALDSLAHVRRTLISIVGARAQDAAAKTPRLNTGMHAALVVILVANGPRVDPGQHTLMGRIALILFAVPVANQLVFVAGSWRGIGTNRTDLHGEVGRTLGMNAVARLGRIAYADTLAAYLTCRFDIPHAGSRAVAEIKGVARMAR